MHPITKFLALGIFVLAPTSYMAVNYLTPSACNANLTGAHQQLLASLSTQTKSRLESERSISSADLCMLPLAALQRSLGKLDNPKPDHPGEAYAFRNMQQLSENKQLNSKNWMAAREFVKQAKLRQKNGGGINSTSWESIGPGNIGGRIRSMVFDPDNSQRLYAGSVSGGVWLSENAGASWQATDDFMANLSVSTLTFDPTNSNIIYAGTGEGTFNIDNIRGMGIFKSTDKGQTWEALAATQNTSNFYWVNRITLNNNSSRLFAATQTGIWTSDDAGVSWTKQFNGRTNDIDVHPTNDNKLVAGQRGSVVYSNDGGISWNTASGINLTSSRVEVAYAKSDPDIVYASIDNNSGEIWKSVDGGASFSLINTGNTYLGSQGWYDNALWVDPINAEHVIVGGLDLWRSTNGGSDLTKISTWWRAPNSPHADHHFIIEHPDYDGVTNKQVYFTNDGGVYTAADIELALDNVGWQELNNQLAITQFYGMGVAPDGTVIGGTQDNGTLIYHGDSESWTSTFGGDGGFSAADPTDSNYLYGEYVYLQIHRSTNGGNFSNFIYTDAMTDDGPNFIAPFILDPNDPSRLLGGAKRLWVSNNVKAASPTWSSIKAATGSNSPISAISVAAGDGNVIYVGHNDGSLFKTINGLDPAPTWTDIASITMPQRYVMRIAIDPIDSNQVFVSYGGYENDNLWKSTDGGTTFTLSVGTLTNKIPAAPIRTIAIHPSKTQQIYVGTEVGIFTSDDGGANWDFNNSGPANVSVDELVWFGSDTLYAATHGRGIFRADVGEDIPNNIVFSPQLDVAQATELTSNTQTITGISVEVDVSIVNGEYSLGCSSTFVSNAGKANDGDTICVRHTSGDDYFTSVTSELTVGSSTFNFESRTAADILPDDISFAPQNDAELATVYISDSVVITGITNQVSVSIDGGEYAIDCDQNAFTAVSGSIELGESICVRQTSSSQHGTTKTTQLNVGSLTVNFETTTVPDTTPDAFSFTAKDDIEIASVQTSQTVTVSGFDVAIPLRISNGEYSIGCDANNFTTAAGEISPDESICVRHTASNDYLTSTTTLLDVNGVTAEFLTTTSPDRTPDSFAFTSQTSVELSTLMISNSVSITGIAVAVPVSISGGEYSIGCTATFTAAASNINNGETICVRHTSSAANNTSVSSVLNVGTATVNFSSTTKAEAKSSGGGAIGWLSLMLLILNLHKRQKIRFK